MSFPTLSLYINRATGSAVIQRFREHPVFGFNVETGEFVSLGDTLPRDCLTVISSILEAFDYEGDLGPSALQKMSEEERKMFLKNHVEIAISVLPDRQFKLCRMENEENGLSGRGRDHEAIVLPPDSHNEQFVEAIRGLVHSRAD